MHFYSILTATFLVGFGWGLSNLANSQEKIKVESNFTFTDETPVWEVLTYFGKVRLHKPDTSVKGATIQRGKELVLQGWTTTPEGKKGKRQSKFFVCTSCHNVSKEFDDLADNDPQNRLEYAAKNKLPFLQGSTLFGAVNRETFYNGDYQKKYGSVPDIAAAYYDLRKAIHVCATQCSQGRPLEKWEMESVMLYLQTLQLKMGDLNINKDDYEKIMFAIRENTSLARAVDVIEARFMDKSPATFVDAMEYRTLDSRIETNEPRFQNGKIIYDLSCKHCHAAKRYSFFELDDSRKTFQYLDNKMKQGSSHSAYKISRYGTSPINGKRAYMPQYTKEKMNDEQLIDLRVYIQRMAQKSAKK
jgi:cytochrome c5